MNQPMPIEVAFLGECMVELCSHTQNTYVQSFGGDTFNTAFYLARAGKPHVHSNYVTLVGDDALSDKLLAVCEQENIGTQLSERMAQMSLGLYMIQNQDNGERSFTYWRNQAPARQLFTTTTAKQTLAGLHKCDWVYLSAITLAILSQQGREVLFSFLHDFTLAGGYVAFDANFRPALWSSAQAKPVIEQMYRYTHIALPSIEDEQAVWQQTDPNAIVDRIHALGCGEVILKRGQNSCVISTQSERKQVPVEPCSAVDTTAAGDSFNGGYLAVRLPHLQQGHTSMSHIEQAVRNGQSIAKKVISKKGALVSL